MSSPRKQLRLDPVITKRGPATRTRLAEKLADSPKVTSTKSPKNFVEKENQPDVSTPVQSPMVTANMAKSVIRRRGRTSKCPSPRTPGPDTCTPTTSAVLSEVTTKDDKQTPYPADALLMAKKRLGLGLPDQLIGRDREVNFLQDSLTRMIDEFRPGSLYLSGPPGTGKTASVRQALKHMQRNKHAFHEVYINCMNVPTASAVNKHIFDMICPGRKRPSSKALATAVQKAVTSKGDLIVLVLDEIDQLETRNHDVLYAAFSWPTLPHSRLAVVGIANSLDLTERVLPKLKLNASQAPRLLQFKPYNKDDVMSILKMRLIEADSLLEPAAVELCARKISAVTGDIRKALDICKLAIERMQRQKSKAAAAAAAVAKTTADTSDNCENQPLSTENKPVGGTPQPTPSTTRVGTMDVLRTVNDVFGSRAKQATPVLPTQQKLLLVAIIAAAHGKKASCGLTLTQLYPLYKNACHLAQMPPMEQSDCANQCRLLESHGLVSIGASGNRGTPSKARFGTPVSNAMLKVTLSVDPECARSSLDDAVLVSSVLNRMLPS